MNFILQSNSFISSAMKRTAEKINGNIAAKLNFIKFLTIFLVAVSSFVISQRKWNLFNENQNELVLKENLTGENLNSEKCEKRLKYWSVSL